MAVILASFLQVNTVGGHHASVIAEIVTAVRQVPQVLLLFDYH